MNQTDRLQEAIKQLRIVQEETDVRGLEHRICMAKQDARIAKARLENSTNHEP